MIVFNIIMCVKLYKNKNNLKELSEKYWDCHFQLNYNIDNVDKLVALSILQYNAENKYVSNVELYDRYNNKQLLSDVLSDQPKLLYFFSEKGCSGCYEPFLYKLDSLGYALGAHNIIVVSDYHNYRSFTSVVNNKYNNINLYRTDGKIQIVSDKEYDYAYAFLINSNRKAEKVIITDKYNVKFTDEYLLYISEYFKHINK